MAAQVIIQNHDVSIVPGLGASLAMGSLSAERGGVVTTKCPCLFLPCLLQPSNYILPCSHVRLDASISLGRDGADGGSLGGRGEEDHAASRLQHSPFSLLVSRARRTTQWRP